MFNRAAFALLLVLTCIRPAIAAEEPPKKDDKPAEAPKDKPKDKDAEKSIETRHKVTIAGRELSYTARAGTIQLKDAEDKTTASIFHIAYTRDDGTNAATRPVTFSFNGGPGSSSVWLHMGLLGPRRVVLEDDGMPLPPPYTLTAPTFAFRSLASLASFNICASALALRCRWSSVIRHSSTTLVTIPGLVVHEPMVHTPFPLRRAIS